MVFELHYEWADKRLSGVFISHGGLVIEKAKKFGFLAALVFSCTVLASADDFTYTYTGNALSTFTGSPAAGITNIQASFTTDTPLAGNLVADWWAENSNVNALSVSVYK